MGDITKTGLFFYREYGYPQTPTTYGTREGDYKFIFCPGIWDINKFFDLKHDPEEKRNLIRSTAYQSLIQKMRSELYDWLERKGGMQILPKRLDGQKIDNRYMDTY